jgi:hypothetical protein
MRTIIISLVLLGGAAHAKITFGDENSAIIIEDGATLNVGSSLNVSGGKIIKKEGGTITGADANSTITFTDGSFDNEGSVSKMSGAYKIDGDAIVLTGNQTVDFAKGAVASALSISGTGNVVTGVPALNGGITLADSDAAVTFGIQTVLEQSVTLNGGTFLLSDDLYFDEGTFFLDSGTVKTEGNVLHTGKLPITPQGDLLFSGSNSGVELHCSYGVAGGHWSSSGVLTLDGNGHDFTCSKDGDDNVGGLDAASGQIILKDIRVRLSEGEMALSNAAGKYILDNATIVIDRDIAYTQGTFEVIGDSTFILDDYELSFATDAALTVTNNATLSFQANYDFVTLNADNLVVAAGSSLYDLVAQEPSHGFRFTEDVTLARDIRIDPRNTLVVDAGDGGGTVTISANNHVITMSGKSSPQLIVAAGTTAVFDQAVFRDFIFSSVSLGAGAELVLSGVSAVHLGAYSSFDGALRIAGTTLLDCQGRVVHVSSSFACTVETGASLSVANGYLTNLQGEPFRGSWDEVGEMPVLALQDVTLEVVDTMYLQLMRLTSFNSVTLTGPGTFTYESTLPISVYRHSKFTIDSGTLAFYPVGGSDWLFAYEEGTTGKVVVKNGTITTNQPSVVFKKVPMEFLGNSTLSGADVPEIGYTVYGIGDGADAANNCSLTIADPAKLTLTSAVIYPNEV